MTVFILKHILDNKFLKNIEIFRFFLFDYNIIFSSKVINFKKNVFNLDFKDSFLFFFDEKETHSQNILINYLIEDFSVDDLIVIETNISNYNMLKRKKKKFLKSKSETFFLKFIALLKNMIL